MPIKESISIIESSLPTRNYRGISLLCKAKHVFIVQSLPTYILYLESVDAYTGAAASIGDTKIGGNTSISDCPTWYSPVLCFSSTALEYVIAVYLIVFTYIVSSCMTEIIN